MQNAPSVVGSPLCDSADNVECLHDWCKKRFDGMGEQLNGFFKEASVLLLHEALVPVLPLLVGFSCKVIICAYCRTDTTKTWRPLTDTDIQAHIVYPDLVAPEAHIVVLFTTTYLGQH